MNSGFGDFKKSVLHSADIKKSLYTLYTVYGIQKIVKK